MIPTIIIDPDRCTHECLHTYLKQYFPFLTIEGCVDSLESATDLFAQTQPELLFYNVALNYETDRPSLTAPFFSGHVETIFLSSLNEQAFDTAKRKAAGYLLKPVQPEELILAVNNALKRIFSNRSLHQSKSMLERLLRNRSHDELVGIPTMEGYEFLSASHIIRCEGLQKCTRVVTCEKTDIVSSYNLGEFIRMLEPYNFFLIHKSHLINLNKMVRYSKEGFITMQDGAPVPLARRRKEAFLERINRF